ncbi:MAG: AMP-binding protein [Acidobacteriota bacterium]
MTKNLYDFVWKHASNNSTGGITFPDENLELDWQALTLRADACAAGLSELGVGHEAVVFLCGRNSSALLAAFLGAQRAGATPSILAPRMSAAGDFIESLLLKIRIARPAALLLDRTIADDEYEELKASLRRSLEKPYADELRICRLEEITIEGATLPEARPSSLAFLQFTSGSVLNPRAVQISHENLEANCRAIIEHSQIDSTDVWVSWLPLFHDMGFGWRHGVVDNLGRHAGSGRSVQVHRKPYCLAQTNLEAPSNNNGCSEHGLFDLRHENPGKPSCWD